MDPRRLFHMLVVIRERRRHRRYRCCPSRMYMRRRGA